MPLLHRVKTGLVSQYLNTFPMHKLLPACERGPGSCDRVGMVARNARISRVLVVTDAILVKLGVIDAAVESLKQAGIAYVIFDQVLPDPTDVQVVAGTEMFLENKCNGLVAIGGGSAIDCAKGISILANDPERSIPSFVGLFQVKKGAFPIIAIPTTAGTGSETTLGAVITDTKSKKKCIIADFDLMPTYAILDAKLLTGLPKAMTAATAIDAITHAVESYLSSWSKNSSHKQQFCKEAIRALMDSENTVKTCYDDPANLDARDRVLYAAFQAGAALNFGNLGYIHAIAHSLGAMFHTPHGVANSMVMPFVLRAYGKVAHQPLSELAIAAGLGKEGDCVAVLAGTFIERIEQMIQEMRMPLTCKGMQGKHVSQIASMALQEAHGEKFSMLNLSSFLADAGYSCIRYLSREEVEGICVNFVSENGNSNL